MSKPSWWPTNPYPESVFTMKRERYTEIVPDPLIRTGLSGMLGRSFWNMASDAIWEAVQRASEDRHLSFACTDCEHYEQCDLDADDDPCWEPRKVQCDKPQPDSSQLDGTSTPVPPAARMGSESINAQRAEGLKMDCAKIATWEECQ